MGALIDVSAEKHKIDFIRHLGCYEYAVRLDLSKDVLLFYEDELEVVK